jgi:3D (Asp-Asp-Asp) domain-containing protein
MKRNALLVLGVVCCLYFACSSYAAALQKDETLFTRSNLRAEKGIIEWHNMRAMPQVIPVGTEVKVAAVGGDKIVFVRRDDNKKYVLKANSAQWDKYFVKDRSEIGLEKFSGKSEVAIGMSKEEVYAAKGCPAYIAWGKKSFASSLSDVMQSNTWYYMVSSRGHDTLIKFENDVVVSIGGY